MPEFIVIIKAKGDPQPHCAVPVHAESAEHIMQRIEAGTPALRGTTIAEFMPKPELSHRAKTAAMWKERLTTLGSHWGAKTEFCARFRCPMSGLLYWLKKFPPAQAHAA